MTKRPKYQPDDAPLTPEQMFVIGRMDAGAMLKGEWHSNAVYCWYLWDGDPAGPDGANVRVVGDGTVNRLIARRLIERDHLKKRESAFRLSSEGKRRARRAERIREGGEWTTTRDSENIYVDHKMPGEVYHEQWVFRWGLGNWSGAINARTHTLVLVRGDQPTPDMAIRCAWQALHRNAQSVDEFTGRKARRAAANEAAMRAAADPEPPPPVLDESERQLIGLGVTPARLETYYADLRRRNAQRIVRDQDAL